MKLSNPSGGSVAGSPSPLVAVDASLYPDYPAGAVGDRLYIELGGKIGGVSGRAVETGDVVECLLANAGGSEAAVGSSWIAYEANIPGTTAAGTAMIQAADATAQAALLTTLLPKAGGTMTGQLINSTNGAASTPPLLLSGTIFTGGTATTTKPALLIEPTGTTSTGWSTSGTGLGVNAPSGFAGNLLDLQVNGTRKAKIASTGAITLNYYGASLSIYDDDGTTLRGSFNVGRWAGVDGFSKLTEVGVGVGSYSQVALFSTGSISWSADGTFYGTTDITLARDAAGVLAQRQTTTAQTFRVYGTTTGSKYLNLTHNGTNAVISASSGNVHLTNLPTSNPGAGILWNNAGTPAIGT